LSAEVPRGAPEHIFAKKIVDISIVGAGPVGILLSIMLARRGYRVSLFEGRPDPRLNPVPGGRSINLTLAERAWVALRAAGVEQQMRRICLPLQGRVIHGDNSAVRFQPYTAKGDAIYSASRTEVNTLLLDEADKYSNILKYFGHRCADVDPDRRVLIISSPDGRHHELTPQVVFAADGAYSTVRRSLLRKPDFSYFQSLSPIFYRELRVPSRPSGGHPFRPDALHLWPRGECMIVGFPNSDKTFTLSIFMPSHGQLSFASLSDRQALDAFLQGCCPDIAAALPFPAREFFSGPPASLVSSGCSPWVHNHWLCLIGDAAHTLVPFLGQGLNAGFEDCKTLLDVVVELGDENWPDILETFARRRTPDCDAVIQLAERHFEELARAARDPRYTVRKALEEKLHQLAPERFTSVYSMVAFETRPYSMIQRLQLQQEAILDSLMRRPEVEDSLDSPQLHELLLAELNSANESPEYSTSVVQRLQLQQEVILASLMQQPDVDESLASPQLHELLLPELVPTAEPLEPSVES